MGELFTERRFQRMSLTSGLGQYSGVSDFLHQVSNVGPSEILAEQPSRPSEASSEELLRNVGLPSDIWLKGDVTIRDIKLKTSILSEVNALLESSIAEETLEAEVVTLEYYMKLLKAYKFTSLPARAATRVASSPGPASMNSNDYVLKEEEEGGDNRSEFDGDRSSSVDGSTILIYKTRSISRRSPFSIDYTRKRFLTFTNGDEAPDNDERRQTFNSILVKSKLYNKIRRHRELSGSLNSATSSQSNFSRSNSVSTSSTSKTRSRHTSNPVTPDQDARAYFSPNIPAKENQKNKYEYYLQLLKLSKMVRTIVSSNSPDLKSKQLLEFLKRNILKMIIVDMYQMISDYGQAHATKLLRKV